jgi:hypothetical protein
MSHAVSTGELLSSHRPVSGRYTGTIPSGLGGLHDVVGDIAVSPSFSVTRRSGTRSARGVPSHEAEDDIR